MAATDNFRSSLHGFNRTDVVQFIQQQTAMHDNAMRSMKDENARLQEALTEARAELEALKAENESLLLEIEVARLSLIDEKPSHVEAPAPVPAPAPIVAQEEPIVVPVSVAPTIIPEMSAPAVSDYNELELMAYRRAEMTERLARERADASTQRLKAIFDQTDAKLNVSSADIADVLDAFQKDYDRLQTVLTELRGIVNESVSGVKAASDICGEV